MTIPEICRLMLNTLPKDFNRTAYMLTELDEKTAREIIAKWNEDIRLSNKKLNNEIRRQQLYGG